MHELRVDEGEAGELGLVDIGDDQLVGWRELRLSAGEELVEVLRSFAALRETERGKDRKWGRFRQEVTEQCRVGGAGRRTVENQNQRSIQYLHSLPGQLQLQSPNLPTWSVMLKE